MLQRNNEEVLYRIRTKPFWLLRIFLEEGAEDLMKERIGKASSDTGTIKCGVPKSDEKAEEDLIAGISIYEWR